MFLHMQPIFHQFDFWLLLLCLIVFFPIFFEFPTIFATFYSLLFSYTCSISSIKYDLEWKTESKAGLVGVILLTLFDKLFVWVVSNFILGAAYVHWSRTDCDVSIFGHVTIATRLVQWSTGCKLLSFIFSLKCVVVCLY